MSKGKIVHHAIKASGIPFAKVAIKLGVSRGTLYNKCAHEPDDNTILRIGSIISHDFTIEFPHLKKVIATKDWQEKKDSYYTRQQEELLVIQRKYMHLLEIHKAMLYYVINTLNCTDAEKFKDDMIDILEHEA